jgi:hypothetical protein
MLRRLTHIRVSAHLIQKVAVREVPSEESMRGWFDGFLGTGNLLPFAKSQSKLRAPDSINYPIPAACDHRLRWLNSFMSKEKPQPEVYRYAWFVPEDFIEWAIRVVLIAYARHILVCDDCSPEFASMIGLVYFYGTECGTGPQEFVSTDGHSQKLGQSLTRGDGSKPEQSPHSKQGSGSERWWIAFKTRKRKNLEKAPDVGLRRYMGSIPLDFEAYYPVCR